MVKNKKCLSCGTGFSYCPDFSMVDKLKPAWASQFCSETCKDLWMTLTRFSMNKLTKSEAKEIISSLNIKSIDSYVSCVQRDYAKIMEQEKKQRKIKKPEPMVEIESMVESEQPIEVYEPMVIEPIHEVVLEEKE